MGLVLIVLGAVLFLNRVAIRDWFAGSLAEDLPEAVENPQAVNETPSIPEIEEEAEPQPAPLPETYNLKVPFTTQAPHANWELPYQEACEEASALIVHHYWAKTQIASPEQADEELLEIVAFENQLFGYYEDTTAEETAQLIREMWKYEVDVIADPTVEMIKREVANGFPVIIPAYGKALDNPNFRSGGPLYHMLVVKGYTAERFITNDPGTRKGADFTYTYENLMNAIHDWNGGDVPSGDKVMIVVRGR